MLFLFWKFYWVNNFCIIEKTLQTTTIRAFSFYHFSEVLIKILKSGKKQEKE